MNALANHRTRTRPEIDADIVAACYHLAELAADADQPLDCDIIGTTAEGLRRMLTEREATA